MSSTLFIAVQCFQCSTMQVKQKKKSSNWTCVVCNQKQSVRKVFAQGYMAKDIRKVVQTFNMSRKLADEESEQNESLIGVTSLSDSVVLEDQQRKKRPDWNEYLDPTEHGNKENAIEEGDEFGPKIVTELPKELFKKPKLNKNVSGFDGEKIDESSYKPVFSKRNAIPNHVFSQGKEGKKHQAGKVISPRVWSDLMTRDSKEPKTSQGQLKMGMKGSKWDTYMSNDENNFKVRNSADDMDQCTQDMWEKMVDDQKVEDDVHPDFM
ncbi:uncharacterized protein [Euphorbia lathyris]|uniref:uncharacterized protein n=1 Tax=Euphorbia lathyris TaxID=212925 RepID=UPI0033144DB6